MGFFDIFRKSVKKTKQSLSLELDSFSGKITFDTLEELEEILILADVGVTTAGKICSRLGERIKRRNIDSTELRENLCEIVTELMEPDEPLVTAQRGAGGRRQRGGQDHLHRQAGLLAAGPGQKGAAGRGGYLPGGGR